MPWFLGNSAGVFMHPFQASWVWTLGPLVVWSLFWTAFALWHAARRGEKGWFVFFLLVHTAGILEIFYLLVVAKALESEGKSSKRKVQKSK